MEMISIVDIFDFCWVQFLLQGSEIIFAVLSLIFSCKSVSHWMLETGLVLTVDCLSGCPGKALTK